MKFTQQVQALGAKKSKGVLDNGTAYDSTKVFLVVPMNQAKGQAVGFATDAFDIGLSSEFDKWERVTFPAKCEADFEIVSNGKASKVVCTGLRLLKA